jgi:hypothetical protein
MSTPVKKFPHIVSFPRGVGCSSVFFKWLFTSFSFSKLWRRLESEWEWHSKLGAGEFITRSRKRRSIYSSLGDRNLCDEVVDSSEDETTSSFKQPSQPPATNLIRPVKKPCVSVSSHDSDKHSVIKEEDATVLSTSKNVNVCVLACFP